MGSEIFWYTLDIQQITVLHHCCSPWGSSSLHLFACKRHYAELPSMDLNFFETVIIILFSFIRHPLSQCPLQPVVVMGSIFFPYEIYGWSPLGEALEKILFSDKRIDIGGEAYWNHALSTFCSICCPCEHAAWKGNLHRDRDATCGRCLSRKAWLSGLVTKQLKQACHCLPPNYSEGKKTEFLIV